jgi:hypothetical protein
LRKANTFRNGGRFHETVTQDNAAETGGEILDFRPFILADARLSGMPAVPDVRKAAVPGRRTGGRARSVATNSFSLSRRLERAFSAIC